MIIPSLTGKVAANWNANQWAMDRENESALLVPGTSERLMEYAKGVLHADYLYGGWMEDRSFILRGCYMEPSLFRHLGMDISAPAGSIVVANRHCQIVQEYCDAPETEGWGTRIMVRLLDDPTHHLVYGHLAKGSVPKTGTHIYPGGIIGSLGDRETNGGWSPHLHIQAIKGNIDEFMENPASLDGYGELSQLSQLAERFPDPMRFIQLA